MHSFIPRTGYIGVVAVLLLSGCDVQLNGEDATASVFTQTFHTASGAIHGVKDFTTQTVDDVKAWAEVVQNRIQNVKEGFDKIGEGAEQVQEGFGGSSEE